MVCIGSHGKDYLNIRSAEGLNAVPVKRPVLIHGPHRDVNGFLRFLFIFLRDGPDGRTDEVNPFGERIRTRLEVFRGINDRISIVVVLYDVQDALHRVAVLLQTPDLLLYTRHGEQHPERFDKTMLHIPRGIPVEREGRRGGDIWDAVLERGKLSPISDRVRYDHIRLQFCNLRGDHTVQRKHRGDKQLHCKRLILSDTVGVLLVFHLKVKTVTRDELSTGFLDLLPEHFEREIIDLMPGLSQRSDEPERRICMAVSGDTEPCDPHLISSFTHWQRKLDLSDAIMPSS